MLTVLSLYVEQPEHHDLEVGPRLEHYKSMFHSFKDGLFLRWDRGARIFTQPHGYRNPCLDTQWKRMLGFSLFLLFMIKSESSFNICCLATRSVFKVRVVDETESLLLNCILATFKLVLAGLEWFGRYWGDEREGLALGRGYIVNSPGSVHLESAGPG